LNLINIIPPVSLVSKKKRATSAQQEAARVTWRYRNPVDIRFGARALDSLDSVLGRRAYCLVTYDDANDASGVFAALTRRVIGMVGAPAATVRNIGPNPDYRSLHVACGHFAEAASPIEAIVALGGGSVIDAAKVLAAACGDCSRVRHFLESGEGGETLGRTPIIAIPTTSGTGSEVTCWATVWDTDRMVKYSLARDSLYPECAIVDPLLTVGLPRSITVSTGLDALSHALESLWNVNANPVSSAMAEAAAREIIEVLPRLTSNLQDTELRTRMAKASLQAGLAFSNTKTALAHSLSYPITLHHKVPHGIACSFSLPMVMRAVIGCNAACDAALARIFGPDLSRGADRLEGFLTELGVSTKAADHGVRDADWAALIEDALAGERGRNFIGRREALIATDRPPPRRASSV
jgi:alcohol dehydrogenase